MKANGFYIALIVAGFFIFLAVPFISQHELKPNHIFDSIENKQVASELENRLRPVLGEKANSFSFQSAILNAIDATNISIISRYSLSDSQTDSIQYLLETNKLDQEAVDQILSGDENEFQHNSFTSYGNWMYGKVFASREAVQSALLDVLDNIENYEIKPKYGIDRYETKRIKYALSISSITGFPVSNPWLFNFLTYGIIILGSLGLSLSLLKKPAGIDNTNVFRNPATSRKWLGIIIGTFLILFYILLYFRPEYMSAWIVMANPVSFMLSGNPAGQFFLYGFLYTLAVLVMGVRMIIKYRYSRYQIIRTASVMFFQLCFAFLVPEILVRLNQPYFDFKNIWPLDYDFFFDFEIAKLINSGQIGVFMFIWGVTLTVIAVPIFTYFYGKRWYCSWVCGCGGLAETLGDPFRHLSDKSVKAWYLEQGTIYSVLVFAILMTAGVIYTYITGSSTLLGINTYSLREVYGVFIGAGFAGVVGTGFYPFLGNRVWCRFGCPLAAYMGIIQRFKSRFRITTNGGQCISCGNCSTYCEMGIDVRSYAQRGENIVRASCVGCGICATVCPRGVLKLENADPVDRFEPNGFIK